MSEAEQDRGCHWCVALAAPGGVGIGACTGRGPRRGKAWGREGMKPEGPKG